MMRGYANPNTLVDYEGFREGSGKCRLYFRQRQHYPDS